MPVTAAARTTPTGTSWSDRLFDALPVAPIWVGAGIAVGAARPLRAALGHASAASRISSRRTPPSGSSAMRGWASCSAILAAFVPTAERYARLGARRHFEALRPLLGEPEAQPHRRRARARRPATPPRGAAGSGSCSRRSRASPSIATPASTCAPATGLPRTPGPGSWARSSASASAASSTTTLGISRRFSELAQELARIDLLVSAPLAPFGRQGLLFALLWLLMPSIFALNAMDRAFAFPIAVLALLCVGIATAALLLPVLGVHRRIQRPRRPSWRRVIAAIRGEPGALAGSAIAQRERSASLADLSPGRRWSTP